jgi:3-hydroxyisobutyrate dehydrogenase-like beta-hydroxyacid dehydrogenase
MAAPIAFVGLGKLGLPMAARLAAAGHIVQGYDRETARRDLAAARGVTPRATLAEAIAGASIVFSSLPDDKVLTGLCLGPEGLLAKLAPDTIYAETSTVSPQASSLVGAEAEARKIAYIRLPMSGNPVLAEAGTLTCFASGPKAAFETLQPILGAMTRAQTWLGSGEEARYAKLAVNLMIAVSAGMMAEALVLARKGGIAWGAMLDVIAESAVGSPFVKYKVPPLAKRDFSSTFSSRQMAKDLDLILAAARSAEIAMPLAALMREAYSTLAAQGRGDEDFIAVVKQAEMLAGLGEPDAT